MSISAQEDYLVIIYVQKDPGHPDNFIPRSVYEFIRAITRTIISYNKLINSCMAYYPTDK